MSECDGCRDFYRGLVKVHDCYCNQKDGRMTDSAARGEGMSELAIRYGYGAGELDFVTFKLYNDGTIKCFGRIGEIKRGKTDCPILGFWREEICASENWEHAERRLKEHKP